MISACLIKVTVVSSLDFMFKWIIFQESYANLTFFYFRLSIETSIDH